MIKLKNKNLLPDRAKNTFLTALDPFIKWVTKYNIDPNTFTTIGLLISLIASFFMATGFIRLAAVLLLLSGFCDTIDGKLARHSNRATKFGALYDSTLDRYSEVIFFFGMAFHFIKNEWYLTSVAIAVGLGGSLMVSYVRARAESLGFNCEVGLLSRPERILLLGIGGLIHPYGLVCAIWIIAVLANITAIQRILHVWNEDLKNREQKLSNNQ